MFRSLIVAIAAVSTTFIVACGGAAPANNSNSNSAANTTREIKLDPANMPPGLSGSPVPISPDTPGISVNATPFKRGTTPIPGIPSEEELKKKKKPGVKPTPGIPDETTIRKAMGQPPRNVNGNP